MKRKHHHDVPVCSYKEEKKKGERESKEGKALYLRNGARPAHLGVGMVAHWDDATPPSERRNDEDAKARFLSLRLIAIGSVDERGSCGWRRHWNPLKLVCNCSYRGGELRRMHTVEPRSLLVICCSYRRVLERLRTSAHCVRPAVGFQVLWICLISAVSSLCARSPCLENTTSTYIQHSKDTETASEEITST
jgi:hypothetical protein